LRTLVNGRDAFANHNIYYKYYTLGSFTAALYSIYSYTGHTLHK